MCKCFFLFCFFLKIGYILHCIFDRLPCIESYTKVDMRTVSFDVPPQEVLTKDSVTVAVDAVGNGICNCVEAWSY